MPLDLSELRAGVVGCGLVARAHLRGLAAVPRLRVVGLCDVDESRAAGCARRIPGASVHTSLEGLLGERPDVVHVLTPPHTHHEFCLQAIEAGCHVLVEKPMALAVEHADAMIEAARRRDVTLGVCHNFLFEPVVLDARKRIERGELGRVLGVEMTWPTLGADRGNRIEACPWIAELPGGLFQEIMPHPLYIVRALLGPPRLVGAAVYRAEADSVPCEELGVLLATDAGLASLRITANPAAEPVEVRIQGSRGRLQLDLTSNILVCSRGRGRHPRAKAQAALGRASQLLRGTAGTTLRVASGRMRRGHERLIDAFYQNLRRGAPPPVSGEDGRAPLPLIERILEAVEGGPA